MTTTAVATAQYTLVSRVFDAYYDNLLSSLSTKTVRAHYNELANVYKNRNDTRWPYTSRGKGGATAVDILRHVTHNLTLTGKQIETAFNAALVNVNASNATTASTTYETYSANITAQLSGWSKLDLATVVIRLGSAYINKMHDALSSKEQKAIVGVYASVCEWHLVDALYRYYEAEKSTPNNGRCTGCTQAELDTIGGWRTTIAKDIDTQVKNLGVKDLDTMTASIQALTQKNKNSLQTLATLQEGADTTHQALQTTLRLEERVRQERRRLRVALWVWAAALVALAALSVWAVLRGRLGTHVIACAVLLVALALTSVWGV